MIHLWMQAVFELSEKMLEDGYRYKLNLKRCSNNQIQLVKKNLSESDIETIKWIQTNFQKNNMDVHQYEGKLPQQKRNS